MPSSSAPVHAFQADSAGDIFRRAGQLRRAGKYEQALVVYRDLQAIFPATEEAHVAFVAVGRLLLDQGRGAEAITSFNRYLAKGGSLAEDALVGRAWALHQLGRSHEEAAAWHALLEQFPRSAHAPEARAQIATLESP
jgi:tetratricopeptide (TPR) repeat protein